MQRLDSTASYTSEDEPNPKSLQHQNSFMSQQSQESVISYYNPATSTDEEDPPPQTSSYHPGEPAKRTFSYTSDEAEDPVSHKRQKFASESTDQSDTEPVAAVTTEKPYQNQTMYSDKSMRMMEKMGYKKDAGLGRLNQGRVEPIEASHQKGRRGLGMRLDDLDKAAVKWDPAIEELHMPEKVEWLVNNEGEQSLLELNADSLSSWVRRGEKKLTIDNETMFCDENILKRVLESKSVFDNLGAEDMRRSRTKSNPFETIRGNVFLNRAAVKMANMDSMFDFMFTNPVDEAGSSLVGENDLLYFADVCAGKFSCD